MPEASFIGENSKDQETLLQYPRTATGQLELLLPGLRPPPAQPQLHLMAKGAAELHCSNSSELLEHVPVPALFSLQFSFYPSLLVTKPSSFHTRHHQSAQDNDKI